MCEQYISLVMFFLFYWILGVWSIDVFFLSFIDSFDEADPEQQVPLGYKKFYLQEQSNISDVALLG